eukprot:Colp12_sorted_trinity150504_noHs@27792
MFINLAKQAFVCANKRPTQGISFQAFRRMATMKAVRVHEHGDSSKLVYEDVPKPAAGNGSVLVKILAAGVNFIDTYHRSGLYPLNLPVILGREGAGVVEAVGSGVTDFKVGDKIAFVFTPGTYCEYTTVPVGQAVHLPAEMSCEDGAAAMLQGLTAHYLVRGTYHVKEGDTILVHAAAGGTGLLLTQMCKLLGARVVGTCSSAQKAALAKQAGADEVILYTEKDFVEEVKRITGGKGVDAVLDGVGKDTFDGSLKCLKRRGAMVSFGNASGKVPPVDIMRLTGQGSVSLHRPSLADYIATKEELTQRAWPPLCLPLYMSRHNRTLRTLLLL